MSSATPDAERTPTDPSAGSSAGGSHLRRWRGSHEAPEVDELDEAQAADLVRRSADDSRGRLPDTPDPVSAESAGIEEEPDDRHVVIEVERWSEPAPSAEELAELQAKREAAEAAAAAATERVIAQAIATGMTDPDELPAVRRGVLRRRTGYYSPAPARPVVDPAAAAAVAERAQELKLPRKVRRELEKATREMTATAEAAHAAREAAERAAAAHAEQTAQAQAAAAEAARGREAAERAAHEHAVQARTEAQRRTVAEQLASETVERITVANAERVRVEEEARRQAAAAEAAHQARAEAEEAALLAIREREAAEARAQQLAVSLYEARAALLEQAKASIAAAPVTAPETEPVTGPVTAPVTGPVTGPVTAPETPASPAATAASPAPAAAAAPKPKPATEQRIRPEGVPELVEFRSPSSSAFVTVLLGICALVAAGVAVYEAYLDRLTTTPGIVASAVTLLLVVIVGRAKGSAGQVWLEHGILHVDEGDSHRRFDLTTPSTLVEMVGRPGDRRWKVLFMRKGMAPYEVNARLVQPEPFVEAIRPWRPKLGG